MIEKDVNEEGVRSLVLRDERFVIDEVHSTHSTAFVERTIDGLEGHSEIVLNPGS